MKNQYRRADAQEYLTMHPDVSKKGKKKLLAWIKNGNTPYSNDRYVFDKCSHLLDFPGAIRSEREYFEKQWKLRHICGQ